MPHTPTHKKKKTKATKKTPMKQTKGKARGGARKRRNMGGMGKKKKMYGRGGKG